MRNAYKMLAGKPEGERPRMWEGNIKTDFKEMG
jgi:hypothetical protein